MLLAHCDSFYTVASFSQNLTKECFVTPFFHITHVIHVTLGTARAPSQKRMKEKENTVIF